MNARTSGFAGKLLVVWVVWGGLTPLVAAAAEMAAPCSLPRPQDSLWLVSCRAAGCGTPQQVDKLQYWRYDRTRSWVRASLEELVATDDPAVNTTVFMHGNRISWGEAFTKCWYVYGDLARCADERPIRFIAWSWPSEAVHGLIEDARVKACRTDPAGYQLAWFLDQLSPDAPVSLWGHSFGARIATGALHLLGGGTLAGNRLATRVHATRKPMQLVLVAAAIDNHWLNPGHHHGAALSQTDRLLLVNNGCDALLKRYHLVYDRRSGAEALGYTGLPRNWLAAGDQAKVSQFDASGYVGRRHLLDYYLSAPGVVARMRAALLGEPLPAPKTAETVARVEDGVVVKQ